MDLVDLMNSVSLEDNQEYSASNFKVLSYTINDIRTDVVYGEFVNKCMVIITQYQKIGSLLKVTVDQPAVGTDISEPVYSVTPLFGTDSIEAHAASRYIAEKLKITKPLMVSINLRNYKDDTLKTVVEAISVYANK